LGGFQVITRPAIQSRHLLRVVSCILLLVPLAVTSSQSPEPPYHIYYIDGSIERAGGGNLQGFTIVLMHGVSGNWRQSGAPDLTDEQGRFRVNSDEQYDLEFDSLVVAMVSPDTTLIGNPFPASEDESPYAVESLHHGIEDGFLCDDTVSSWKVDGYEHGYTDKVLPIP
jgi:hypothetical protein